MSSDAPWAKIWWDWYTTRSHVGIGVEAKALGPVLMLLGKASPGGDDPGVHWILRKDGQALSHAEIGALAELTPTKAKRALAVLVRVETLRQRKGDGAFGFDMASWRRFQGTSTERTRKHRGNDQGTQSGTAPPRAGGPSEPRDPEGEAEGQRRDPTPVGGPAAVPSPVPSLTSRATAIHAHLRDALQNGQYSPPAGCERLRLIDVHLLDLAQHLGANLPKEGPKSIAKMVLKTVREIAAGIDAGKLPKSMWWTGGFLTGKSYEFALRKLAAADESSRGAYMPQPGDNTEIGSVDFDAEIST